MGNLLPQLFVFLPFFLARFARVNTNYKANKHYFNGGC